MSKRRKKRRGKTSNSNTQKKVLSVNHSKKHNAIGITDGEHAPLTKVEYESKDNHSKKANKDRIIGITGLIIGVVGIIIGILLAIWGVNSSNKGSKGIQTEVKTLSSFSQKTALEVEKLRKLVSVKPTYSKEEVSMLREFYNKNKNKQGKTSQDLMLMGSYEYSRKDPLKALDYNSEAKKEDPASQTAQNNINTIIAKDFDYIFIGQSTPVKLQKGQTAILMLKIKNNGSVTWQNKMVHLGTSSEGATPGLDRASIFYDSSKESGWLSQNRIIMKEDEVNPGQIGTFLFQISSSNVNPGKYREYFRPVIEGKEWMKDLGIYWDIEVI